jgi:peptide/nickel transport system ATP-binding protein
MLQIKNLKVAYQQKNCLMKVLDDLSFELKKSEILSLLGESGSGKSTIAKAITGLLPPSAQIGGGTLHIGSASVVHLADNTIPWNQIRGRQIAMIFQDAQQALNPVLTIKEHFKETLLFHHLASADEIIQVSTELLSLLNFTDGRSILDYYPFQLSGGMCQRICLALALCLRPKVLIADEITSALDTVSQKEVLDLLKRVQEELGLAILLITHDIAVANAISNRVIVLNKGVIEEDGETRMVFSKPQAAYTRRLLSSRSLMNKRDGDPLPNSEPILNIMQLGKKFSQKKLVLSDLNLTLHKREILGILGQSGCGKSTLARCIVGLEHPNRGRILYRGTEISSLQGRQKREICRHIQLVFQDARASLNPRHTALRLVQEPLRYLNIARKKEREELARFYLNEVGISDDMQIRRPPQLSTGQCQRIAIARALVLKPEILICDEAVSALDMRVQSQILMLLRRLYKQFGFSMLMISHDIRVLRSFCHSIAVMKDGNFCEILQAGSQFHGGKQSYTQLLLECERAIEIGLCLDPERFPAMKA